MATDRKARTREAILDAAYSLVARMGVRRTTFEDVATKAGLSRQTLYRYFDGKDDLIAALMDRESERFLAALHRVAPDGGTLSDALSSGLSFTFDYMMTHPLLSWVYEHEPDELLPHLRSHWLPILGSVRDFIEPFVQQEVSAGRIPAERAHLAGDWVSRVAISYLITPGEFVQVQAGAQVDDLIPSLILNGLHGPGD